MSINYSKVTAENVQRIDLNTIEQNMNDFVYKCYESFLADLKWIVHNLKVYDKLGKLSTVFCPLSLPT